jgi:hypothetical protein
MDERGQIWCYDPKDDRWKQAFMSPLLKLQNGAAVPRDVGYRRMAVFQAEADRDPSLYVSTISMFGGLVLCSKDGKDFLPISNAGLQKLKAWSFRVLVPFNGNLYLSPTGKIGEKVIERNLTESPAVFASVNPAVSPWRRISQPGFGEPTNGSIFALEALNDHLYAGTTNPYMGFQIWKTQAKGSRYRWKKVITAGAFRGNSNQSVASMCAFRDALYVGTGIQGPGRDKAYEAGPAAAELIRIYPDDTWELLVGERRPTFEGMKIPQSGFGPGFDNQSNSVIWQLAEHDGWLYAGTHDWRSFLAFPGGLLSRRRTRLRRRVMERFVDTAGGFELWRSQDGTHWEPVTRDGFGNPNNCGLRTMLSTPAGLFLGTVTIPSSGRRWTEDAENLAGGCEIWCKPID